MDSLNNMRLEFRQKMTSAFQTCIEQHAFEGVSRLLKWKENSKKYRFLHTLGPRQVARECGWFVGWTLAQWVHTGAVTTLPPGKKLVRNFFRLLRFLDKEGKDVPKILEKMKKIEPILNAADLHQAEVEKRLKEESDVNRKENEDL